MLINFIDIPTNRKKLKAHTFLVASADSNTMWNYIISNRIEEAV
jgi:hypothetical protein